MHAFSGFLKINSISSDRGAVNGWCVETSCPVSSLWVNKGNDSIQRKLCSNGDISKIPKRMETIIII